MCGIDEPARARLFEHVVDRFPVHPGALPGHLRHALGGQPIPQGQQVGGHRPKCAHGLYPLPAWIGHSYTHGDRLFVHIESGTPLDQLFHSCLLPVVMNGRGPEEPLPHDSALRAQGNNAGCQKLPHQTHGGLTVPCIPDVDWVTVCISIAHVHGAG